MRYVRLHWDTATGQADGDTPDSHSPMPLTYVYDNVSDVVLYTVCPCAGCAMRADRLDLLPEPIDELRKRVDESSEHKSSEDEQ